MTEEVIERLEADLVERLGGWAMRVEVNPDELDPDNPASETMGVLICDRRGGVLEVTMRIGEYGAAELTARAFDADGRPGTPMVFASDESVLIHT